MYTWQHRTLFYLVLLNNLISLKLMSTFYYNSKRSNKILVYRRSLIIVTNGKISIYFPYFANLLIQVNSILISDPQNGINLFNSKYYCCKNIYWYENDKQLLTEYVDYVNLTGIKLYYIITVPFLTVILLIQCELLNISV